MADNVAALTDDVKLPDLPAPDVARPAWFSWSELVKRVIARFARGNIAAQEGRILLPEEQEAERARARATAKAWHRRAQGHQAGDCASSSRKTPRNVVEMLRDMLAQAERGEIAALACCYVTSNQRLNVDWAYLGPVAGHLLVSAASRLLYRLNQARD